MLNYCALLDEQARRPERWNSGRVCAVLLSTMMTRRFSLLASGPPLEAKGADLSRPAEARDPGRNHLGMAGDIISERWAELSRNGGRHHSGIMGRFARNRHRIGTWTFWSQMFWGYGSSGRSFKVNRMVLYTAARGCGLVCHCHALS
jgi:hypothetical protein